MPSDPRDPRDRGAGESRNPEGHDGHLHEELVHCSFCGRDRSQVDKLVAGPAGGVYICDDCIELAEDIVAQESGRFTAEEGGEGFVLEHLPTPREIHDSLDDYVVGQEHTKKVLAVAVHNHYKRVMHGDAVEGGDEVELAKSNILLLGPTGTGKTLLAQTLARVLDVPFAIADATALTEAGYVGEDVENILLKIITAADYDVERAEVGIIYVDEIDKVARKAENLSITRDVSGEGVQQALLKIVEGTEASVPPQGGRKHPQQELIKIDTTNILFILGGAFVGLDRIIADRIGQKGVGFSQELGARDAHGEAELFRQVLPEDLHRFGLIPEFVGRVPVITSTNDLTVEDLVHILTEPKNALVKQYQRLFQLEAADLIFTDEALREVAEQALKHGTGARGLRSILEGILLDTMYEIPSDPTIETVTVTRDVVLGQAAPEITRRAKKGA